jgi:phage terminase large subunit-like protein
MNDYTDEALASLIPAAREHPTAFTYLTRPHYDPQWFHYEIGDALRRVSIGTCKRLIVNLPPRHGKSLLMSVHFPVWYFGRHPEDQIIAVSYNTNFAEEFGSGGRDVFSHPLYPVIFPGVSLRQKTSTAKGHWEIASQQSRLYGRYHGTGIGGDVTGRGANVLIVDDPIRHRKDADSEAYRRDVKDFYTAVAIQRLEGDGAIVIGSTRWHEDDLVGWLLSQQEEEDGEFANERWEVINFPIWDEDTHEPLWPGKFPQRVLDGRYRAMMKASPRDWYALNMGTPRSAEGNKFNPGWWNRYDHLPQGTQATDPSTLPYGSTLLGTGRFERPTSGRPGIVGTCLVVDSSFKRGVANDYSVIAVWGMDQTRSYFYLLDLWRDRVNITDLCKAIYRMQAKWAAVFPYEVPVVIEDIQSGTAAIQMLSAPFPIIDEHGSPKILPALSIIPWPVNPGDSPEAKADAIVPIVQSGRVFLPRRRIPDREGKDLVQVFIEEHALFPAGKHDDTVATSWIALPYLKRGRVPQRDEVMAVQMGRGRQSTPLFGGR